jgi:UDP:flavonoid glycosyltransferase YjiC (YdhE family)
MKDTDKIPSIGVFPGFFDIGETYPLLKIAENYEHLGGKVFVYSHGGEYEDIANDSGFNIKRIQPIASGPDVTRYFIQKNDEEIIDLIKNQKDVFTKDNIAALIQTSSYLDCILSANYAKIPVISVISGTLSTPFFQAKYATFPDNMESYITKIIPGFIKNRITNWHTLHYKGPVTRKFNRLAEKLGIEKNFRYFQDIRSGDYTLISDDKEFLGLSYNKEFPNGNFIGPILSDDLLNTKNKPDPELEKHLKQWDKSILLTMGSSKIMKSLFSDILDILNDTDYGVIATYTSFFDENNLPKVNSNILLKKFIPNISEINKKVDLAIIHGGRGTVYNAAFSGKPSIGYPLNGEQQFNIDSIVRHESAIRLSKTFFDKKKLLYTINDIFENYEFYLENAKKLSKKLQPSDGGKKAASRILKIVKSQ